jgi:uncharacterized protein (DUF1684 family)
MAAAAALGVAAAQPGYREEIEAWRTRREERLRSETGWLTVAGLFWLKPGDNSFGSDPDRDIVLPAGAPARAGVLVLGRDADVAIVPAEGVEVTREGKAIRGRTAVALDAEPLQLGRFSLQPIRRGDRIGLRLRDPENALRRDFPGLAWYPVDEHFRVTGRFAADTRPQTVRMANVLGQTSDEPSPGTVELEVLGRKVRLRPIIEDGDTSQWFYVFKDETAPKETYGAGRFVYSEPARDGVVTVDFNKAYNPPCAFNPYTTCPLPPKENVLPLPIRAGEKKPLAGTKGLTPQ